MPGFLTPAKIGLLTLIGLYADEIIPTSAAIPVLNFILVHLKPRGPTTPASAPVSSHSTSPLSSSSSTGSTTSPIRELDRSEQPEPQRAPLTLHALTVHDFEALFGDRPSATLPGRSLWDVFLASIWGIDSLDELHNFFGRAICLLVRTREEVLHDRMLGIPSPPPEVILFSRSSPLGVFVRRAQFEFVRLKFHEAVDLWRSFVEYRQDTFAAWRLRSDEASTWTFDTVLELPGEEWGDGALEMFAAVAYGGIPMGRDGKGGRGGNGSNEGKRVREGEVSTDDVEDLLRFQVEQMQKLGDRVPDIFQNQMREVLNLNVIIPSVSHYVSFLDAWRAGDYTTSFDNLHRYFDYTMQNKDRGFYQYALLNLAVLQADFGCFQEAVTAMQETVSVARENKDMGCLNFSLSWLYHFGKAHPKIINSTEKSNLLGVEREGLTFLRIKAKESGMWSLYGSALLSEAKADLSSGESLATAFEKIIRSSHISTRTSMMSNVSAQMMLQSAIWSRLGITHLASSFCDIFLAFHNLTAPFEDVLKFTCRSAYLLAEKGQFDSAMWMLEEVESDSLRSLKAQQYHDLFSGILRLKRHLHHNDLAAAEPLLEQLLQCRDCDPDLAFELSRLQIEAITRRGDYSAALERLEAVAKDFGDHGEDVYCRVRLLIMKAHIFDKCGRPQKGFSIAVRAAAIAWRARLLSALWPAMAAIANILTSLNEFSAAAAILASVTPRALEYEDSELNAQLFSLLVDAHMGLAGQADEASPQRTENLTKALRFAEMAWEEFANVEDFNGKCEMQAKMAIIVELFVVL